MAEEKAAESQAEGPDLEKIPIEEVLSQLDVKPDQGLSADEAKQRLGKYGPNAIVEKETSIWSKVLHYFMGPIAYMIEAAAIAEEVVGHPLWGHVSKSGPRPSGDRTYPKEMPFVETLDEASHFRKGPSAYAGQTAPWRDGDALIR